MVELCVVCCYPFGVFLLKWISADSKYYEPSVLDPFCTVCCHVPREIENVLMQLDDSLKGEVTADYVNKGVASKVTVDTEGSWAKASTSVTSSGFRVSLSQAASVFSYIFCTTMAFMRRLARFSSVRELAHEGRLGVDFVLT